MSTMSQNVRHPHVGNRASLASSSYTGKSVEWLFGINDVL